MISPCRHFSKQLERSRRARVVCHKSFHSDAIRFDFLDVLKSVHLYETQRKTPQSLGCCTRYLLHLSQTSAHEQLDYSEWVYNLLLYETLPWQGCCTLASTEESCAPCWPSTHDAIERTYAWLSPISLRRKEVSMDRDSCSTIDYARAFAN